MKLELIVLDIDETLIHTETCEPDYYDFKFLLDSKIYFVTKRPYLDDFLSYLKSNYKIGVFTTSTEDYASEILKTIGLDKLDFLYDRSRCTEKYFPEVFQSCYIKRLSKIKNVDLDRTVIIDDRGDGAQENYGNLIKIKPFYVDKSDNELLKLIDYLETIKDKNVRNIEKRGWDSI